MTRPRRTSTSDREPDDKPLLLAPRAQVDGELSERIMVGEGLAALAANIGSGEEYEEQRSDYYTWNEYNKELLARRFSTDAIASEYSRVAPFIASYEYSLGERIRDHTDDVVEKVRRLTSIRDRLPLIDESGDVQRQTASPEAVRAVKQGVPESVFIVHGHDGEAKLAVQGFLRAVTNVPAVILHEQPNQGRTVIEKFEQVGSASGFAIAILTADDEGRAKGEEALNSRGRQNVVFEFGYFVGLLGRAHTVVLYEEDVELPSDLKGLLYVPYDAGGAWKMLIAKELKASGVEVDLNKAV